MDNQNRRQNRESRPPRDPTGLVERERAYLETLRVTGDRRAATRAYCAGNRWLTENAKNTGNW